MNDSFHMSRQSKDVALVQRCIIAPQGVEQEGLSTCSALPNHCGSSSCTDQVQGSCTPTLLSGSSSTSVIQCWNGRLIHPFFLSSVCLSKPQTSATGAHWDWLTLIHSSVLQRQPLSELIKTRHLSSVSGLPRCGKRIWKL